MKKQAVKAIAVLVAVIALVMLVGDMPDASLVHFAAVKIAGLALLWGAAKILEKEIPFEEV